MVSTAASQQQGSSPSRGLSGWSLHVLLVLVWIFSGYSGFLLQSKTCTLGWLVTLTWPVTQASLVRVNDKNIKIWKQQTQNKRDTFWHNCTWCHCWKHKMKWEMRWNETWLLKLSCFKKLNHLNVEYSGVFSHIRDCWLLSNCWLSG